MVGGGSATAEAGGGPAGGEEDLVGSSTELIAAEVLEPAEGPFQLGAVLLGVADEGDHGGAATAHSAAASVAGG